MPAGMMFPVAYFASDYQPRRQFLLDSYPDQRIDLADRIYFICLGHLSSKTGKDFIPYSLRLSIIRGWGSFINFQMAAKSA
jgi:hypothetical protein